jgi:hypothetical protein
MNRGLATSILWVPSSHPSGPVTSKLWVGCVGQTSHTANKVSRDSQRFIDIFESLDRQTNKQKHKQPRGSANYRSERMSQKNVHKESKGYTTKSSSVLEVQCSVFPPDFIGPPKYRFPNNHPTDNPSKIHTSK